MAQFFKAKPNKSKQLSSKLSLDITQLDHLGAGMAQYQGKVVFVAGGLPDEKVTLQLTEQKKNYAKAKLIKIEQASAQRREPKCPHYVECGGCDLQHLDVEAQREHKQNALVDLMSKLGQDLVSDDIVAPAITGDAWHYRRRARLATVFDKNTHHLQLGFRQTASSKIASITQCSVLAKPLSDLITPFAANLNQLKSKSHLGHLELSQAENGLFAVLRVTKTLPASDIRWLAQFAATYDICLLLQDNDNNLTQLHPQLSTNMEAGKVILPFYSLAIEKPLQQTVRCEFTPGNFVQVNGPVNHDMVAQALNWLDPQVDERVLDLFCGVGNFSLPLASSAAKVIGVEGVPDMVQQAKNNAVLNQLDNLSFHHADLSADLTHEKWLGKIDKLLLDPARAGAFESLQWLKKMRPKKVVYVSCNPASLARDSKVLIEQGYQLSKIGMVDMFPQTHHIEAMALFELNVS
ncbi:23S rRNA (uracil(1939)-C(5))-methyltransferase RlmD [Shewanella subflava]|uniref:23S rRNA (uracil(1939)-C(5))-methyltransferase RlmD n=1 Tax=Shewanella subflava TaxID=2986476 RepID=A0ABT3I9R9_9GAMM|nr:23S rRNA (uracil(1939)-C(5))-methyltransferase RlmD [Shewanella subflava]MCW3172598.1 23S rRNA (uracil(1939)-C(5))-methyltransferase RlmD [Shewanella subflava]